MAIRQKCINFIVKLIQEISNRVPDNIEILKHADCLSVENTLKTIKEDINDLLILLKYSPDEISKIDNQWRKINLIKRHNISCTIKFWIEVANYKNSDNDNPFFELSKVALIILTLPHSNAEIERLFSQINLIKYKLRNRMKLPVLNAILAIRSGLNRCNKCCFNFDLPKEILDKIGTNLTYETEDSDININEFLIDDFLSCA